VGGSHDPPPSVAPFMRLTLVVVRHDGVNPVVDQKLEVLPPNVGVVKSMTTSVLLSVKQRHRIHRRPTSAERLRSSRPPTAGTSSAPDFAFDPHHRPRMLSP